MRKLLFAAALAASALMAGGVATAGAADTTVTVKSKDTGNNWYSADTRLPGTGTFEVGPAAPPLGNGSFELKHPGQHREGPAASPTSTTAWRSTTSTASATRRTAIPPRPASSPAWPRSTCASTSTATACPTPTWSTSPTRTRATPPS